MSLPKQAPPVRRPEIVEPHRVLEVDKGPPSQLLRARLLLMHGANFNDPARYEVASFPRMRVSSSLGSAMTPGGRIVRAARA